MTGSFLSQSLPFIGTTTSSNNNCNPLYLNNHNNILGHNQINNNNQQQQLALGKSDRMSKEKQKFFRFSAFNSERVIKSPTKQTTAPLNNINLLNNASHSNSHSNNRRPPTPARPMSTTDEIQRNYKKVRNKVMRKKKHRKHSTESSSSSSSSDDDEEEELSNSSSNSSSSSDDNSNTSSSDEDVDDETTSSSCDESNDKEQAKNLFGGFAQGVKMNSWSQNESGFRSPNNNAFGSGMNGLFQSPFPTAKLTDREWGFAAEAKKNIDIFNHFPRHSEKIFGSSASVNDNVSVSKREKKRPGRKKSEKSKNQTLDGLFDGLSHFFTATDINRQKLKEKKSPKQPKRVECIERKSSPHPQKIVLKETRRTYRDYENSLRLKNSHTSIPSIKMGGVEKSSRRSLSNYGDKLPNFAIMSSDDDFSQLSPSKMVKRAIIGQKYDNLNVFMPSPNGFGSRNSLMDFAQLVKHPITHNKNSQSPSTSRVTEPSSSSSSTKAGSRSDFMPLTPPYNNSKLGKNSNEQKPLKK